MSYRRVFFRHETYFYVYTVVYTIRVYTVIYNFFFIDQIQSKTHNTIYVVQYIWYFSYIYSRRVRLSTTDTAVCTFEYYHTKFSTTSTTCSLPRRLPRYLGTLEYPDTTSTRDLNLWPFKRLNLVSFTVYLGNM
jgi:hypothetical protein